MSIGPAPYFRAIAAGLASGMRASTAISAIALAAQAGHLPLANPTLANLAAKRPVASLAVVGVLAELVIDKLPITPARVANGGWTLRVAFGGIAGGVIAQARGGQPLAGAALGAAAAMASTWGCYWARVGLPPACGVPDAFIAVGEDGLAISLAAISVGPVTDD